jgi:thiol-disulfide isomerase/thioredoxin
MNIGPITLPVGPVIFFASLVVALFAARLVDGKRTDVESAIYKSVLIGLVVARVFFVLSYLPGYGGDFLKMLDVRDLGFSPIPGVLAGVLVVIGIMARRRNIRRPLFVGAVAGLISWFAASSVHTYWRPTAVAPVISLFNTSGTLQPVALHDGKPFVVNLWATWCPPCQDEMPVLADAQAANPRINLVFVNQGEQRDIVEAFLVKHNLHIDNALLDPELGVAKATGATAYPTTFFYDASGHLLDTHVGRFSQATFGATLDRLYPSAITQPSH